MTTFSEFRLAEPILRSLSEEKYVTPTPIQSQAIPLILEKRDVIGIAQTGTGKTAAFALPILNHLAANRVRPQPKHCRVLVLSPTRELSIQILDSFRTYGRHLRVQSALAIGGVNMGPQVRALSHGVDVLVATPGRLLDLAKGSLRLDSVEIFVLDEADRMLDMGFIHDIKRIIAKLPKERQTLLFSATMPTDIAELARQMLRDPAKVAVTPVASTAERIAQRVIHVDRGAKANVLADLLRTENVERALVFTRTKHGADKVVRFLNKGGIAAEAIHGNKSQNQRQRVLDSFRDGRVRTLVATDIAARGIDVDGISHVVNFDLPNIPESYVHRIGRTARAGAEGVAISLCSNDERPYLRDIEKLIRMAIPASGAAQSSPHHQPQPHDRQPRHGQNRHAQGQRQGQRQNRGQRHGQSERRHGGAPQRHERRPEQPQNQDRSKPRPVASTTPIGGDFSNVAFMQPR